MKKLFYLFLLIPMLFISCGEDDGDGITGDIIGTWTIDDADISVKVDGKDIIDWFAEAFGITSEEAAEFVALFSFEDIADEFSGTITFNSDGTYTSTLGDEAASGTWSLTGDNLTISDSDGDQVLDVLTLNSSTLVIAITETDSEDLDDDGVNETMEITIQLNFSK